MKLKLNGSIIKDAFRVCEKMLRRVRARFGRVVCVPIVSLCANFCPKHFVCKGFA
jgi:hypothetical protein